MPEQAFRTFAVDAPYAAQTLRKRLVDRKAELSAALVGGYAHDWGDYCKRAGVIEGLTEAIANCEEAMKQERQ